MTTIEQQFINNDGVFICSKCDKRYKQIKKKNGKYNKTVLKHFKIACERRRKRNIQAYKSEKKMMQYYENKYDNVRQVNNRLFIKDKETKEIVDNPKPKADWMLGDKRIQYKKSKSVFIHNWTRNTHLEYIKRVHKKDLKNDLVKMVLSQKEKILHKLRSKKKKSKRTLKKLCINVKIVENDGKIDENLKIKDLQTKKIFIHWDKNEKNNFYYLYGEDRDNLIHMTDSVINKTKVIYVVREIYSDSGKTNLGMQNIFENDKEINDMIKEINERKFEK